MSNLEDAFGMVLGRQVTDKDRQALYRVRDALGLLNNDAVWLVMMALGYYDTQYRRFPGLIAAAAKEAVGSARTAAETEVRAAAAQATAELTRTATETARDIAGRTASAQRWRWIARCVTASALVLAAVGTWGYHAGYRTGDSEGSERAWSSVRAQEAAKTWASTEEGQFALGPARAGSIRELAMCSDPGWVLQGNRCRPRCGKTFAPGWRVFNQIETPKP